MAYELLKENARKNRGNKKETNTIVAGNPAKLIKRIMIETVLSVVF